MWCSTWICQIFTLILWINQTCVWFQYDHFIKKGNIHQHDNIYDIFCWCICCPLLKVADLIFHWHLFIKPFNCSVISTSHNFIYYLTAETSNSISIYCISSVSNILLQASVQQWGQWAGCSCLCSWGWKLSPLFFLELTCSVSPFRSPLVSLPSLPADPHVFSSCCWILVLLFRPCCAFVLPVLLVSSLLLTAPSLCISLTLESLHFLTSPLTLCPSFPLCLSFWSLLPFLSSSVQSDLICQSAGLQHLYAFT